jgi:hypothetical protein
MQRDVAKSPIVLRFAYYRDQGTDVVDILAGRIIPLRLGYVPVVNRGQRDIDNSKTIASALENERKFFENHSSYASKAQYCGTPYLARKLNVVSVDRVALGGLVEEVETAHHLFGRAAHRS